MFKRILVSVSDKSGLVEFINSVCDKNSEIVSTGGTSRFLKDSNLKVTEVADVTGFPEMLDGRVRTLHPKIHMALLARSFVADDFKTLKEYDVEPFDLVIVNLYPFEEAYKKGYKGKELIEKIDVGGPSMLRAAAKSFERLTVVCDPSDYALVSEKVKSKNNDEGFRQKLAAKVFNHCAYYDSLVAQALNEQGLDPESWCDAGEMTFALKKKAVLRYGENPHQRAVWYESSRVGCLSLNDSQILQGKELSYNNIVDLEAAVGAVADFSEAACVIVKHATPCGVALGSSAAEAYKKAFNADSISAFGGIVAVNRPIDEELARALIGPFLECVIAPRVDLAAQEILKAKKNLRILTLAFTTTRTPTFDFKSLRGGVLIQDSDSLCEWSDKFKVIASSGSELTASIKDDLKFALSVVRHVKSNAIVVAKSLQTLGICGGQTNRIDSTKMALDRARAKNQTELVLGSDAFFPFRDSIDLAASYGVKWIIQPGGSLRDPEVEAAALEHGIGMVITGMRQFKH
jgi:phosphoribosylaminoimidazolecarboxamide formyltransferase/IMP cyclohydrolase